LIKNGSERVHRTVSPSRGSAYPSNEPSQPIATRLALVQPALSSRILDPRSARAALELRLQVLHVFRELVLRLSPHDERNQQFPQAVTVEVKFDRHS